MPARLRDLFLKLMKVSVLPYGIFTRERRSGVTILCYHRVGGRSLRQVDLPVELFEWQMRYIQARYEVVPIDDVVSLVAAASHPARDRAVITFDDGYEDVYHHAFPVLRRYRLPATIYLTTAYVEARRPLPWEPPSSDGRPVMGLTWDQAREMKRSELITFGAHTHTHADVRRMDESTIEREIGLSNQLIAERLGHVPAHFAYPWGRTTTAAETAVRRAYRTAVVGGTTKNVYGEIDLFALRRVPVQRSDGCTFFKLKMGSYLRGEDRLRALAETRRRRPSIGEALP